MDYQSLYNKIVNFRKNVSPIGYSELHHIIPKSIGGTDSPVNLVLLTAREHFVCHLLLVRIHQSNPTVYGKMLKAWAMMAYCSNSNQHRQFRLGSRIYSSLKEEISRIRSAESRGVNNNNYGNQWIVSKDLGVEALINKNKEIPTGWVRGRLSSSRSDQKIKRDKTRIIASNMFGIPYDEVSIDHVKWAKKHVSAKNIAKIFRFDLKAVDAISKLDSGIDQIYNLYVIDKLPTKVIQQQLGIQYTNFTMFLKNLGIPIRSMKESVKISKGFVA